MAPTQCAVSPPPAPTNAANAAAAGGGGKGRTQLAVAQVKKLCKQGRLEQARRLLLDALPRPPPTLLCNVLLIAYVAAALPDHALRLYALLNHAARPAPRSDHYTYSCALTACARSRRLRLGRSVHAHLLRRARSLPDTAVLRNSLLNLYASCARYRHGRVDVVRRLFDAMPKKNVVSWNTLFGWYVKTGRPDEALEMFVRMLEDGVRPTPVSFVNVFPAAGSGDPSWPFLLYGLVIKHGVEYVNDLFVVSSAIGMFSEIGDMRSARIVFDRAAKKNIEVWNTMITGYVQNGQFSEAMDLFIQIVGSKEVPSDVVTFLSAVTAASQSQDVRLGQQLHGYLMKGMHSTLPVILGNALVVMYSRCGNVQTAFELFDRLPEKDIVSWNTMITAFVQNDFDLEGLLLVYQMQKSGFIPDTVTLTAVLSAASNTGDLQIGKQSHGYLIRHGIEGEGLESYLIDMYAKSGRIDMAQTVFDGYGNNRDEVTWNAMIAGYTQGGQPEQAVLAFRAMIEAGVEPTSVTLASVLPACDPVGGGVCAGKQIHSFALRHSLDTNVFVGTALVDMYSKCGEISAAENVFGGMTEKTTVTYTTMISGLGQHGFGERALSLFYSMRDKGLKPDAVTFLAAISACNYSGLVDEGLSLYRSMETFGLSATPQHHCCIVDLLAKAGRVDEAYDFVESLGEDGNFIAIWGSLLASCKTQGKMELAAWATEKVLNIEKQYGHAGYNVLLSQLFAAEGNWSSADGLRKEMRLRGLRKEAGSTWIKVQSAALQDRSVERNQKQNCPENDHMFSMLDADTSYSTDAII
ncbi:pentatricopeptide repeat-containing protein At3g22150, chloroplastic [Aegilops tauschii subsp. strangulata]|nr:pentatricopeptide repeat-containing protein At3g22150, chloroplastic [Aegilops tauschii subsp. strangulata]